jgi:hypothetical protein
VIRQAHPKRDDDVRTLRFLLAAFAVIFTLVLASLDTTRQAVIGGAFIVLVIALIAVELYETWR